MQLRWLIFGLTGLVLSVALIDRPPQAPPRHSSSIDSPASRSSLPPLTSAPVDSMSAQAASDQDRRHWPAFEESTAGAAVAPGSELLSANHALPVTSTQTAPLPGSETETAIPTLPVDRTIRSGTDPAWDSSSSVPSPASSLTPSSVWTGETSRVSADPTLSSEATTGAQLAQALRQFQRAKLRLEQQFADLQRDRNALGQELQARKQQVVLLEQWVTHLRQELTQRDHQTQDSQARLGQLEADLNESRAQAVVLDEKVKALTEARYQEAQARSAAEDHAAKLEGQFRDQQRLQHDLSKKEQMIDELGRQLDESRKTGTQLATESARSQQESQVLKAQLKEIAKSRDTLDKEKRQVTQELAKASRELDAIKRGEKVSREETQARQEVEAKLKTLQDEQQFLQQAVADAQRRAYDLTQVLEERDQETTRLKKAFASQAAQLKEAESVVSLLQSRPAHGSSRDQ